MTKKPLIVPIFIPNQGCPYRCIYCQQEKITSQSTEEVNALTIAQTLDKAIQSDRFDPNRKPEVAFYGGTFTKLTTTRMKELLGAVSPYLKQGLFQPPPGAVHAVRLAENTPQATTPDLKQDGPHQGHRQHNLSDIKVYLHLNLPQAFSLVAR